MTTFPSGSTVAPTPPAVSDVDPAFLAQLSERFGDHLSTAASVREHHGTDESPFEPVPPAAVVFAESVTDVVDTVNLCQRYRVPLIAYGAGSSIEGQLLAVSGGVSLDMSAMNNIIELNAEDMTATVQPGVTRKQLNQALRETGLFFPIDPGADATLGGMVATRASGTNAVRYGTMKENVLSLAFVTTDGRVVRSGSRARKSSAGYDLTRLMVGSEGTLGVITEITVRLHPLPEATSAAIVNFPTAHDAINTVIQTIQLGVPIARCEFLDPAVIRALNDHSKVGMREAYTLLCEFHGSPASVEEQAGVVEALAQDNGGNDFEWASRPEDRSRLWEARHNALFACLQQRPGCRAINTDTCVPISRLAESIEGARAILEAGGLPSMIVGHVGDGNFHCVILIDADSDAEMEAAEAMNAQIVRLAISLGGTCTGEHGIGLHKIAFLPEETGDDAVHWMRQIKRTFDPDNILNPGKIFAL